jgi:hypothetical protein
MTAALTPATAVAYLAALTARLDGAAVAAADGSALAGDPALAAEARAALARGDVRPPLHAAADARHLVAVRTHGATPAAVVAADLAAVLVALGR